MSNHVPDETIQPLALRPKQAAAAMGISERLLWSITADTTSGIPHTKIGRCIVYPVRELRQWLSEKSKKVSYM